MHSLFETILSTPGPILAEGSVYERLRRQPGIEFDPLIAHAGLVYDETSRAVLAEVHEGYMAIARQQGLPLVVLSDTWRASAERIARSRFTGRLVNQDNLRFMQELRSAGGAGAPPIVIAGLSGPLGDAYKPAEAPNRDEARRYHAPQIEALVDGEADVLYAATLPSVEEARGIADAMAETGVSFVLSFVVRPDGRVLDGTPLVEAIGSIDAETRRAPVGYSVNCVHPSVFEATMSRVEEAEPTLVDRVIWFQANTSDKSPEEIDGSETLEEGDPVEYASALANVGRRFRTRVLGGCCGSDVRHIELVAGNCVVPS